MIYYIIIMALQTMCMLISASKVRHYKEPEVVKYKNPVMAFVIVYLSLWVHYMFLSVAINAFSTLLIAVVAFNGALAIYYCAVKRVRVVDSGDLALNVCMNLIWMMSVTVFYFMYY